jgi:hypothetical protein
MLCRHKNADQIHDIKVGNRFFENMAQFKYLGKTVSNENLIQEEIERRKNFGNVATIQYRTFFNLVCCLKT